MSCEAVFSSIDLSIRITICVSIGIPIDRAIGMSTGIPIDMSISMTIYMTICVSICVSIGIPIGIPIGTPIGTPIGILIGIPIRVSIPIAQPASKPLERIPFLPSRLTKPYRRRRSRAIRIKRGSGCDRFARSPSTSWCFDKAGIIWFTRCLARPRARHSFRHGYGSIAPGKSAVFQGSFV